MKVFRSLAEIPEAFGPTAVTIGNFDGVHIGHQRIMSRLGDIAKAENLRTVVLTFDPHPVRVLAPERASRQLMTLEAKLTRLRDLGLDAVLVLPFSHEFSLLSPETFVQQVLCDGLHARVVLVGRDFRFGHRQAGDVAAMGAHGAACGLRTEPVESVLFRGERISSTAIRNHLQRGEVSRACRMLGGPFTLTGPVVKGHGIGSRQTVPTLNLAPENELLPRHGVYVTRTSDLASDRVWPSITNIGYRPTFDGQELTTETFLLSQLGEPSPERIGVQFLRWVREERKFDSPEALKAQILKNAALASRVHRRLGRLHMG